MKRVLMVLGQYLPHPSANGICCEKIVSELRKQGYEVNLVVNRELDAQSDDAECFRVPRLAYQRLGELRDNTNNRFFEWLYRISARFVDRCRLVLFSHMFPIASPFHLNSFIKAIKRAVKTGDYDLLIGVNMPVDSVMAATIFKEKNPNTKLLCYFLDPLAGGAKNSFLGEKRSFDKALSAEARILKAADAVVVQKEHRSHYEQYFDEQNRRNIYYYGAPLLSKHLAYRVDDSDRTIVYAGALSKTTRNPQFILDVFQYVKKAKLIMYVTKGHEWVCELAKDRDNVEVRPGVSHDEILRIMDKATGFLNIGNTQAMFAPSKVIEYISFGKPLITTHRVDNDTSLGYVSRYRNGLVLDERTEDPKTAAQKIDEMMESFEESIPYEEIEKEYWDNTPYAVINVIKDILDA